MSNWTNHFFTLVWRNKKKRTHLTYTDVASIFERKPKMPFEVYSENYGFMCGAWNGKEMC